MGDIKLTEFIHLFDALRDAFYLVDDQPRSLLKYLVPLFSFDETQEEYLPSNANENVKKSYALTNNNLNPDEPGLFHDALEEVENRLYSYIGLRRNNYIKDIFRAFNQVNSVFIDLANEGIHGVGMLRSIPELYVRNCLEIYKEFFLRFDIMCLCLEPQIDLMDVQSGIKWNLNISIYRKRNRLKLTKRGYKPELDKLLENQKQTFKSNYKTTQLEKIRKNFIGVGLISDISENDFLYLFTEQPITSKMTRLIWNGTAPCGIRFLELIVSYEGKFNFKQAQECVEFKNGKLVSQNRAESNHKCNKILNPLLLL